mmetsp:Transcript_11306/g.30840  ORF Transcript_11306/g.30840 Transcript_11306/m.30840 type:complete len:515 (-) Transcript_11306:199-1743(-)
MVLDIEISAQNGQGEGTMMEFIKQHMASILQPFADHVDALHRAHNELVNDFKAAEERATNRQKQLNEQKDLIKGLRDDLDSTSDQADATQTALKKTNEEKDALETAHRNTQTHLEAVEKHLHATADSLQTLTHAHQGSQEAIENLKAGLAKTDANIAKKMGPGIQKLRADLDELTSAHKATSLLLKKTADLSEGTRGEFQTHLKNSEQEQFKNKEAFATTNSHITYLTTMLEEMKKRYQTQTDLYRATNAMVGPMGTQMAEMQHKQEGMHGQQKETMSNVASLDGRVKALDKKLAELMALFGADQDNKAPNLTGDVKYLHEKAKEFINNFEDLEQTTKKQEEDLQQGDRRTTALESGQSRLWQVVRKLEEFIGAERQPSIEPKQELGARAMLRFQQAVQQVSITAKQKAMKTKLEDHDRKFEKTHSDLQTTNEELEATEQRVATLESDLAATINDVMKLKNGLDLTQEYWAGLRNGLRETHKNVAVENKMLPSSPARPATSTLPKIEKGALTAR